MMDGTTLCPHCDIRFKITGAQLEMHHGMVRCGHCLNAFDARPNFSPDQADPQLELPMLGEPVMHTENSPVGGHLTPEVPPLAPTLPADETTAVGADTQPGGDALPTGPHSSGTAVPRPMTLAEQITVVHDENGGAVQPKHRIWPWAGASALLLLMLIAQAAYFFRIDLAARMPALKPALVGYCQLLKCSVPLPLKTELMSIESSDLEADHTHENQIALNALLRNRAPYTQAFPNLELTLNDNQDKPLARRIFGPTDYLPPSENEKTGLLPNHELSV
ncbi:MAG: DUF3426 domain-containing protein, partial [Gallionella sp.]